MHFEIITPEAKVFDGEVSSATFPGEDGVFQVLASHAPLMSILKAGEVNYKTKEKTNTLHITGGVVEVLNNKVILLADGVK